MLNLIIFLLIAYGATNIMVYGSIFEGWRRIWGVDREDPRFFGKLFGCFMCLSFWWGVLLSMVFYSPTLSTGLVGDVYFISSSFIGTFLDACMTSGSVWLIHTFQEKLER